MKAALAIIVGICCLNAIAYGSGKKLSPGDDVLTTVASQDKMKYFKIRKIGTKSRSKSDKPLVSIRHNQLKAMTDKLKETEVFGSFTKLRERLVSDISLNQDKILKKLDQQKERSNDLAIKTSRLWQKEKVRMLHDQMMEAREEKDAKNEKEYCEREQNHGTVVFPAVELAEEFELGDDTVCMETNRVQLLKSFCSMRVDLDDLFQAQKIRKQAKSFWPNICCKERREDKLSACADPSGKINRAKIIPFALAQGGTYTRHNVYAEVFDVLKVNGYLQRGMLTLIQSLDVADKNARINAMKAVKSYFREISLCGPRMIDTPGKSEGKMCQLFIPYQHAMKTFYNLIEQLSLKPLAAQQHSFLETMETAFKQRKRIVSTDKYNVVANIIKTKSKVKESEAKEGVCTSGLKFGAKELRVKKRNFCSGHKHLDLSSSGIQNIAMHYLSKSILEEYREHMVNLKSALRFQVDDDSCPRAPLFKPKDISIQRVAVDTSGTTKEWVAVVNLNTKSENGYLNMELPRCEAANYMIHANIKVKAMLDASNCCVGSIDVTDCMKISGCGTTLKEVQDTTVLVTGAKYHVEDSGVRHRRTLLQESDWNVC